MDFFKIESDFVKLELNPKLYNLETIYSAAYQLMEDAYIYFEGDPDIEIIVNISNKNTNDNTDEKLANLAKKFLNHLINYTFYKINSKNKEILRALLLKKSFGEVPFEDYNENEHCETCAESQSIDNDNADLNDEDLTAEEKAMFEEEEKRLEAELEAELESSMNEDIVEDNIEENQSKNFETDIEIKKEEYTIQNNEDNSDDLSEEDFEFDDPEGIAIPWEEKNTHEDIFEKRQ